MYKLGRNKLDHSERNINFPYDYVLLIIKKNDNIDVRFISSTLYEVISTFKFFAFFWITKIASLRISYLKAYIIILNAHLMNILVLLIC